MEPLGCPSAIHSVAWQSAEGFCLLTQEEQRPRWIGRRGLRALGICSCCLMSSLSQREGGREMNSCVGNVKGRRKEN